MCGHVFTSFSIITRSVIAGSYGKIIYSFLRNHQTVFQSGCIHFAFPPAVSESSVSPHPRQHLVLSVFQSSAIQIAMQWYLIVVLICISQVTYDVENVLICVFAICIPSVVFCPFHLFLNRVLQVLCIF